MTFTWTVSGSRSKMQFYGLAHPWRHGVLVSV